MEVKHGCMRENDIRVRLFQEMTGVLRTDDKTSAIHAKTRVKTTAGRGASNARELWWGQQEKEAQAEGSSVAKIKKGQK